MPIIVQIGPSGVQHVVLESASDQAEDAQLALWPVIRQELARLDRRLRREASGILERRRSESGDAA